MASSNNRCVTYLVCGLNEPILDEENNPLVPGGTFIARVPCVSTENVNITQNKSQPPACRNQENLLENVDSTSFSATGQIEIKNPIANLFALIIHRHSCLCLPCCMLFLNIDDEADPALDELAIIDDVSVTSGIVICGVPDANWTRNKAGKNLSFTITPTSNATLNSTDGPTSFTAGKYSDWRDFIRNNAGFGNFPPNLLSTRNDLKPLLDRY